MAERTLYNLKGQKRAAVSFAIMAMAAFAMQIERMLLGKSVYEFAYMALLLLCWLAALAGTRGILKYKLEYGRAYRASMVAIVCVLAAMLLAYRNWRAGGGDQTFIQFDVQFFMYTQMMAMMYCYAQLLKGSAEVLKRTRDKKKQASCRRRWIPCVTIIILSLFAVQIANLFSGDLVYIIAGSAAVIGLVAHFAMITLILSVYNVMDGRPTGQRRQQ